DGIRDRTVTGVQTCALPILARTRSCSTAATSTAASGTNSTGTSSPGLRRMKSFRSLARRSDPAPDNLVRLFQSETAEILETPERSEERRVGKEGRTRGRGCL